MKKSLVVLSFLLSGTVVFAQQTNFYKSPDERFQEAKEYFVKEQYSLAYPILRDLQQSIRESDIINNPVRVQEINFFVIVSALKQNESSAEQDALSYIEVTRNNPRVQMLSFHLAEYYFRMKNYASAARLYESANIANLDNRQIADLKFHQGYSYFTMQQFAKAKPLLDAIRQVESDPNYIDANYYYGFIAFRDRQYGEALKSFRIVENEDAYSALVPYYIAQILYVQGQKEEAIRYAETKLKEGKTQYYDLELKQLLGHAYFEKKQYAKAIPLLQDYVTRSTKVRREDLYELSYSYYQAGEFAKSIEGFRQLSGKEDSLSQHAMYLLGDSYLKTGQRSNARNAFLFSASNSSNATQREISRFNYAKLSYELGYQDEALRGLRTFANDYPDSKYREEAIELLAAALANTNNYREAQELVEGIRNPSTAVKRVYPRILYGRATELVNDARLDEADALLTKAMNDQYVGNLLPLVNFWKGEIAYRQNDVDAAIRHYHAYLNAGAPSSGEANARSVKYNLGYAYYRKENYGVARSYFEPLAPSVSLSSDPITQDAYIRTADAYYMARNYGQARTMYDNVIRLSWPAEDYATYQKAMIAGISNSNEKITLLNTLSRKFPGSSLLTDAQLEIANTHLANENYREAIPYLTNLSTGTAPATIKPQAHLKLGIAHYNLNNADAAITQYRSILTTYPNSPEAETALDNLKTIYVEQGRPGEYAEAARSAGKPISTNLEDSLTFAAARLQFDNNKIDLALSSLNNYIQRFPEGASSTEAQFLRGEIYADRKDWTNAISAFSIVAQRAPNAYAERAVLLLARMQFFEIKNYSEAEKYYAQLKALTSAQEVRLEAMRGLLRSQYQQQKWADAVTNAKDLIAQKGSSSDDKALANMAIGKSAQINGVYDEAIQAFRQVVSVNKAALGAEARYEIANSYFLIGRLPDAEKAAFEVINKSGSYDWWVTRAYLLLGEVYFKQKDYFNAKATFQSIVDNTLTATVKAEAQARLDAVIAEEAAGSKIEQ